MHGSICPQCCGEQREVTLDCPSSCTYLQQARQHEKPQAQREISSEAVFGHIEIGRQFLHDNEHLVIGLSFALAKSARADQTLKDADLIVALASLAKSYETLANSGLHYEDSSPGLRQQAISAEVRKMVEEYRQTEKQHTGSTRLRDKDVVLALVFLLRMAYMRTSGRPKSRAFIDFLLNEFKEPVASAAQSPERASSLILP